MKATYGSDLFVTTGVFPLGVFSIYDFYLLGLMLNGKAASVAQKCLNLHAESNVISALSENWGKKHTRV